MLQAKLKVVGGRHHGKIIPLAMRKFLIGREQDCHLRPNSELVSRHHCALWVDDFSVRVRDLGSTNGTFVNNQRVRGECVLGAGDRIRVGKLDFELLIGDPAAEKRSDSSQLLPGAADAATSETTPLATTDTGFEIPVPAAPEDTGSSILAPESLTPVPSIPDPAVPGHNGDSTVVWSPPTAPAYGAEMYPPMGMPYQPQYQPAYPYMPPGMGYQTPMGYPQMPMGYPGMYPQMGGYAAAPSYAPQQQQQPVASPEPAVQNDEPVSMPSVRLPDPKTTGAKVPEPPPPPPPEPEQTAEPSGDPNEQGAFGEEKKAAPPPNVKPADNAADILKKYTQRRPV
jgi:hypothetical protein